MQDTSPEMYEKQQEITFRMSPAERFNQGMDMINFVRATVLNSLKQTQPELHGGALRYAFFERYYGAEFSEEEKAKIKAHFLALESA